MFLEKIKKDLGTLKMITYCFTQDGIPYQKAIGVYSNDMLKNGIDELLEAMKQTDATITEYQEPSDDCENYFIKYSDGSYFYTSTFEMNKIIGV